MNAPRDDTAVSRLREFLSRTDRRRAALAAVEGASIGLVVALVVAIGVGIRSVPGNGSTRQRLVVDLASAAALIALGVSIALQRHRRAVPVARSVEARAPQCRNVVITAAELITQPARVQPYIVARVSGEAARLVESLDPATLFPTRRAVTTLGITTGVYAIALLAVRPGALTTMGAASMGAKVTDAAAIQSVDITVVPPAYAGRAAQSFHDPARVEALAGSTIRLAVHATAGTITLETVDGKRTPAAAGQGQTFTASVLADADGYIALEPAAFNGRVGIRRLIGLTVTPDLPPRVKVTAPGRDLLFADAHRTVNVTVEGSDDLALATLRLRYTKVSGSGEQFTFLEGEVPLQLTRTDDRSWTGKGVLSLDTLALGAGDMVSIGEWRRTSAPGHRRRSPTATSSRSPLRAPRRWPDTRRTTRWTSTASVSRWSFSRRNS